MALMVGDLMATVRVDDSGAAAGMRRAEGAVRAGGAQMTTDADRAGQQAGNQLGDGLADGARTGGDRAARGIGTALKGFAALAVGAGIGAALMAGVGEAMDQQKITGKLQAQLGTTGPVAAKYGKVAGDLYAGAMVDSVEDGAEVLKGIAQNGLLPPEATQAQIQTMGKRVADTASVMGEDISKVSRAVGVMLKSGIAKSADEAMDVLVKGTQKGVNAAEDLLDTYSEYPTEFRQLGLDAKTSMGLLSQGLKGGARDADVVADSLKEFTLQAQGMSDTTAQAYKDLGLSGEKMQEVFQKGGPAARKAFEEVIEKLRAVEDPAKKSQIALGLFGTKSEDMQKAIFALDPKHAVDALGSIKGATDEAGDAMRDNASTKFEIFKRQATQKVVGVIATYVIPALMTLAHWVGEGGIGGAFKSSVRFVSQHSTSLSIAAGVITVIMLPALVRLAVQAATTTVAVVTGWATQGAAAVTGAASFVASNVTVLAGWVAQGVAAGATAVRVVGAWVLMGAQSLIQGARMAAAWVIAMGPVAWAIAVVVGLVVAIAANWDSVKAATLAAWDWIWDKIKSVAGFLVTLFENFTLPGLIMSHWTEIKSTTAAVWNSIVDWVTGIPGRFVSALSSLGSRVGSIASSAWSRFKSGTTSAAMDTVGWIRGLPGRIVSALGNTGSLLVNSGKNVVLGLWHGIQGMGGWLRSTLMSWAKDLIPGPIAKALGIHSPSRLMRDKIGKFIPAGVVEGVKIGAPALVRAMRSLASIPVRAMRSLASAPVRALESPASPAPQFATTGAPATGTPADGARGATVHIENWHAGNATADQTAAALAWHAKARG
ncbi:phage tail tape measure protein [Streptomyces varsoviensis]|uniref:phage tail tape measure protein n=1 Tax=Streptomyces varsoviensis TaxID=67373 RepID=UPI0033C35094